MGSTLCNATGNVNVNSSTSSLADLSATPTPSPVSAWAILSFTDGDQRRTPIALTYRWPKPRNLWCVNIHQQNRRVAVVLGVDFGQLIVLWNLLWGCAAVAVNQGAGVLGCWESVNRSSHCAAGVGVYFNGSCRHRGFWTW